MGQVGDIGGKSIRAWAVGNRSGYFTLAGYTGYVTKLVCRAS
jgi:hypothetical protein